MDRDTATTRHRGVLGATIALLALLVAAPVVAGRGGSPDLIADPARFARD